MIKYMKYRIKNLYRTTVLNMQQCPSKMGDIRNMFTAGENRVFIGCDFSKQEPCMLASSCMDKDLIKTFTDGLDIYSKIASMIYPEYSYEDCLEHYPDGSTNKEGKKRRSVAKKVVLSSNMLLISEMV